MTEPLTMIQIIDRLGQIENHARALEMAIGGAVSTDPVEERALSQIAKMLVDAIRALQEDVDPKHETERA